MATLDGYSITVETESPGFKVEITSQPIERGTDVTDHVQPKLRTMDLSGRVVGPSAAEIHAYLIRSMESGKIVKYTGRTQFSGLIASFSAPRDYKIADGFTFSLSLIEVKFATSSYVSALPTPVKVQAAQVVSAGVKQTKSTSKGKSKTTTTKKEPMTVVTFKAGSKWAK
jgi:hypothetical protein